MNEHGLMYENLAVANAAKRTDVRNHVTKTNSHALAACTRRSRARTASSTRQLTECKHDECKNEQPVQNQWDSSNRHARTLTSKRRNSGQKNNVLSKDERQTEALGKIGKTNRTPPVVLAGC